MNVHVHSFLSTVISEPKNVTVCEGASSATFTCVLNGNLSSDDAPWYRILKDTGTTERLGRLDDFTVVPITGWTASLLHFTSSMQEDPILDTTGLDYHLMVSAMYLSL